MTSSELPTNIDLAKSEAWRIAKLNAAGDRQLANELIEAAELDVIRKLVSATLAGGEAEYWSLVERMLKP